MIQILTISILTILMCSSVFVVTYFLTLNKTDDLPIIDKRIVESNKREDIESAYEWIRQEQEKDKAIAAKNLKKPRKYNVPGMFCPVKYANITYDGTEKKKYKYVNRSEFMHMMSNFPVPPHHIGVYLMCLPYDIVDCDECKYHFGCMGADKNFKELLTK